MSLRDRYDFEMLINEAQNLVLQELESQLSQKGSPAAPAICTCQDCILDMAALALNLVKPSYRVSLLGSFDTRRNEQTDYLKDISGAVREAISKVRANPSHD